MSAVEFPNAPSDKKTLEESTVFSPRFDAGGLVTVVVTDAEDGMLLMVAHMNTEALALTLETGIAHYWSRSRSALWKKGETSGNVQKIVEMLTDCDQDAIWLRVKVMGHDATCHTGRRSCFYRTVGLIDGKGTLASDGSKPLFDAQETYRKPHEPSI
ncbi:phosphoribosyl-AMP cyclohydrolase [Mesorhizobium sp.]|uniref:phosphoribosyl-AMP cyclohydrolase n=1 Tax=Mesorhizobium sp. TaxID=1871066 RepID=UPI000FE4C5CB|nr:phosphoribosyl-AMP cyclohydrolase [Mesorhizobium sp.]RWI20350.1 MAG: phosphoribosyl-AMP cyclohydrolase [Mesorhizobium sp.]RWK47690.1 MAG: phosphoribosyl-AMP cyclohydrolase [Mesorhizobium sp.]RWK95550.1 MAG: phosphoribosyl-AMP cyclohydrolase [Mesorhizobium sp.]TIP59753.1 MAG: phosphoribosyl-AMP cyclohydrolase [Mesorhizobium sp.]TIP98498.1 MAG: phosphoribosyl-AMP cyclohydrolase [Mesorhizobium sp.]